MPNPNPESQNPIAMLAELSPDELAAVIDHVQRQKSAETVPGDTGPLQVVVYFQVREVLKPGETFPSHETSEALSAATVAYREALEAAGVLVEGSMRFDMTDLHASLKTMLDTAYVQMATTINNGPAVGPAIG